MAITGQWFKETPAGKQVINITVDDLREMVKNFAKKANHEVNVDYDHKSETGVEIAEPIPSAGRITALMGPEKFIDSAGVERYILWGRYEPTERARKLIAGKEYRYTSPALGSGIDKATGRAQGITLSTVALTNRPVVLQMPQIRMSEASYRQIAKGATAGGVMERQVGFGDSGYADVRLSELVKARMEETGETQQCAEIYVTRTSEGAALWEEARKACIRKSGKALPGRR